VIIILPEPVFKSGSHAILISGKNREERGKAEGKTEWERVPGSIFPLSLPSLFSLSSLSLL
jgi:hypothetical protein